MQEIKLWEEKKDCCGCGACANICPVKAITMQDDEYGYIYPKIDNNKCIKCKKCINVCSYTKTKVATFQKSYAAISKQKETLEKSASGGVFFEIAKSILEKGGVIYGASLEKNFEVKHIRVENLKELYKLQGSKYVQSNINNTYILAKEDLEKSRIVLFSGTPCQINGLKGFLGKEYNNLYTIDIICHGVPSNKIFKDFIEYNEKKENLRIKEFIFRDKSNGSKLNAKIKYENSKEVIVPSFKLAYYQLFLDSIIYRENCYTCPYANQNRISDITIGDFWGIEKVHKDYIKNNMINNKKGISCIISNSEQGERLLEKFGNNLIILNSDIKKISRYNEQLKTPSNMPKKREQALKEYLNNNYYGLEKYYNKINWVKNLIKKIKYRML